MYELPQQRQMCTIEPCCSGERASDKERVPLGHSRVLWPNGWSWGLFDSVWPKFRGWNSVRARSRADQHGKARRMPKSTRLSPKGPSSTTVDQNCVAGAARDWRRNPRGPHAVYAQCRNGWWSASLINCWSDPVGEEKRRVQHIPIYIG